MRSDDTARAMFWRMHSFIQASSAFGLLPGIGGAVSSVGGALGGVLDDVVPPAHPSQDKNTTEINDLLRPHLQPRCLQRVMPGLEPS